MFYSGALILLHKIACKIPRLPTSQGDRYVRNVYFHFSGRKLTNISFFGIDHTSVHPTSQ